MCLCVVRSSGKIVRLQMLAFYLTQVESDDDKACIIDIYENHKKRMWLVAKGILSDDVLAEDAVHNAFLGLISRVDKLKTLDDDELLAYITTTVKNAAKTIRIKRSKQNVVDLEALQDTADPHSESDFKEKDIQLFAKQALAQIPDTYKDVLYYYLIENESEKNIAALLQRKESTVRQQIKRGKALFAEAIRKGGFDVD